KEEHDGGGGKELMPGSDAWRAPGSALVAEEEPGGPPPRHTVRSMMANWASPLPGSPVSAPESHAALEADDQLRLTQFSRHVLPTNRARRLVERLRIPQSAFRPLA